MQETGLLEVPVESSSATQSAQEVESLSLQSIFGIFGVLPIVAAERKAPVCGPASHNPTAWRPKRRTLMIGPFEKLILHCESRQPESDKGSVVRVVLVEVHIVKPGLKLEPAEAGSSNVGNQLAKQQLPPTSPNPDLPLRFMPSP